MSIIRRWTVLAGAAVLLVAVGVIAQPVPPRAVAHTKAHCDQVLVRQIDPIVNRGSATSAHNHLFIGANIQNVPDPTRASWADLQSVATTCVPSGDHAVYWIPTLQNKTTGAVRNIKASIAYYGCFQSFTVDTCTTAN